MMDYSKKKALNKSGKLKTPYKLFCVLALLLCVCEDVPEHCGDGFPALNPSSQFCNQDNRPWDRCGGLTYNTSTHECSGGRVVLKGSGATYAVTVTSAGTGASGTGSYAAGATVTISAGTAPSGQQFKNWTVTSGGVTLINANSTTATFTMPASPVTVTAVFESPVTPPTGNNVSQTVNGYTFEMVPVAGGTFTMGCTSEQSDCDNDESPTHSVTLSGYYIGKHEVTQGLWKAVMGSLPSSLTSSSSYGYGDNYPVYYVSWNSIVNDFIPKLNQLTGKTYRLPTEAEWEYAARGGKSGGYMYSGSNTIGDVAWYWDNSSNGTHEVGKKSPNGLGIYDMSGNVWEWVSDWYGSYSSDAQTNPQGPQSGTYRVRRGGGWYHYAGGCRVSIRSDDYPGNSYFVIGFRLVSLSP